MTTAIPTIPMITAGQRYQVAGRRLHIVSVTPDDDFDVILMVRDEDGSPTTDMSATEFLARRPELIVH
jgi:hypothetical protein